MTATVSRPEARATDAPPSAGFRSAEIGRDDRSLRRFLHGLPGVDEAGLERRSAALAARDVTGPARR